MWRRLSPMVGPTPKIAGKGARREGIAQLSGKLENGTSAVVYCFAIINDNTTNNRS